MERYVTDSERLVSDSETDGEAGAARRQQVSRLDRSLFKSKDRMLPEKVFRALNDLELSLDEIEKAGYYHFMLKEIMEQPKVLRDCLGGV